MTILLVGSGLGFLADKRETEKKKTQRYSEKPQELQLKNSDDEHSKIWMSK